MQGGSFRCRSPKRASPGLDKREYSPPSAPCTAAWHAQHTYDLGGDLLTSGYNGAATLNFAYDNSQRLTGVTAPVSSGMPNLLSTLVSNVTPDPTYPLLMHSAAFGNGLTETRGYSPRMWLNSLQVGSVYSLGVSYAGNGDVTSANDSVNGSWTYGYDAFNRLTSAAETGVSYTWDYDRFGNRWHQTLVGVGGQALTFNQNNQITNPGFIYDAAGNLMMDNLNCYSYDAESRLVSTVPETSPGTGVCGAAANGTDYLYDPDGRRVAKIQNGAIAKQFYYDAAGQEIAETSASGTLNRAEIFAGSRHLATWTNNATYFNHADWLGTERVRTFGSGSQAGQPCETITSLPFGDGQNISGNCGGGDPSPNHFTGKERDSESGLDYFGARYNSSNVGRFMSPDPLGGSLLDPQTLNKYSYVRNNPLTITDPTGLYICTGSDDQCQKFETTLDSLRSRKGDVGRAAAAYGAKDQDNGVTVGFADLDKKSENGETVSTVGRDSNGNLRAESDVTINSKIKADSFAAAIGHEGSHAADAQDVVKSGLSGGMHEGDPIHAGMDITHYQSEVRAWGVTQSILRSGNFTQPFACGFVDCTLGANVAIGNDRKLPAQLGEVIDTILANQPRYNQAGKPMGPNNQGPNIVNGVSLTPKVSVPH